MFRTTLTLEDKAHARILRLMEERGMTFKAAVNAAILEGTHDDPKPFRTPIREIGFNVPLDHATTLVGELEDAELLRKRELGK